MLVGGRAHTDSHAVETGAAYGKTEPDEHSERNQMRRGEQQGTGREALQPA
jgi:hypothetical protein